MAKDKPKDQCAHPACTCTVTSGKYCSVECEAMEKTPDIECKCMHSGCQGRAQYARAQGSRR